MERIAHRDLRNRSSEVLRRVAAGETFEVTNHGEVVARLVPAAQGTAPAALRMRRSVSAGPFAAPREPGDGERQPGRSVVDDLVDLRGER